MSMINASVSYRRSEGQPMRVPVVLPLVEVSIDESGHLDVVLDQEPYSADDTLQRSDLKQVVNGIAADLGTPVRVEVREVDHSTFTDIVTPGQPQLRMVTTPSSTLHEVGMLTGTGFEPYEEVAIAVVVTHQQAGSDGTARLRLPPALLEAHPGLVLLLGKSSGAIAVSGDMA